MATHDRFTEHFYQTAEELWQALSPTRGADTLLDWTTRSFTAAYFAASSAIARFSEWGGRWSEKKGTRSTLSKCHSALSPLFLFSGVNKKGEGCSSQTARSCLVLNPRCS